MKSYFHGIFIISLIICSSCQKVIDVKLNSSAPKYVIQGNISDQPGPYTILISQTKDFSSDNNFTGVNNARVTITDSTSGIVEVLKQVGDGNYQSSNISGHPGHTYILNVAIGSNNYSSSSTMPSLAVTIDSVYAGHSIYGGKEIFMTAVFTDIPGLQNYYLLHQWINGKEVKQIVVRNDQGTDGQTYHAQLRYDTGTDTGNPVINKGDTATIELQCINKQVYDYFRTLRNVSGASNSATPDNPLTNIRGGALGVFNTYISRTKTVIVNF